MTMAPSDKVSERDIDKPSRQQRVGRCKVWLLQKRLAELSAQVEAAVLEARQLIAWKQSYQPLTVAELTDDDKRILEHNHRIRLAEVVQRHCSGALKSITQHKWAFPFNNPVDTARFPDYPKIISTPMDFSTIKARQDSGYYRDPKDWWSDVMLVFSNAKRYNAPGSDCYLMAQTLQEVSEEKYDKVIAPRLAEEAAVTLREEVHLKKKRAELANLQSSEAMDAQCAVLFNLMAELHAAIREAKSLASSLCEPLALEEKQALAATIQGLPTAQLESIVAFVASRHPPSVSTSEVPPGAAGGAPSRKVQLNLGRYDPLLLRQLQHLVSTCTAARQQSQNSSQLPILHLQPPQRPSVQRLASPPLSAAAQPASTGVSPSTSPGAGAAQTAPQAGTASSAGAASPSAAAPQQPQGAAVGAEATASSSQQQQQQPAEQSPANGSAAAAAAAAATTTATAATGASEGPGEPHSGSQAAAAPAAPSGSAAAAAASASPPVGSTQRNISDVVTNATASGISMRAGIKWPGLAVGTGVRPRARALLSLHLDGPASAGEMLAACPLPQPMAPLQAQPGPARLAGTKRTAAQALGIEMAG